MLNRFFGAYTHTNLHVFGLAVLAFGLPLNKVVMSVSMMFLVLNVLLEADFNNYWKHIKSNRLYQLILLFFVFHAVSMIWSFDWSYGLHDLRVKLPILVIPTILTAKPIRKDTHLTLILWVFLSAVTITSLINFSAYNQWFGSWFFNDIRGMSLFSSHVRYALLIAMAISILLHFFFKRKVTVFVLLPLFLWFNFYTYYSQILSGVIAVFGVYLACLVVWAWKYQKSITLIGLVSIGLATVAGVIWILKPITYNPEDYMNLTKKTAENNYYYHLPSIVSPETGKPIDIFVQEDELMREWERVSDIPYSGRDIKGQYIRRTIIRYMASMDLTKDAEGFKQLSRDDIEAIEKGYASMYHRGIIARIYGLKFQVNNVKNPNGHSFLQRLEYWRTGLQLAKKNWLFGVGNGDVQLAFHKQYELNNSKLEYENKDRAHNMYLTILLSLGIVGFALMICSHFKFIHENFINNRLLPILFMVILLLSYLIEDTLETQTGATFFALFFGLFSTPTQTQKNIQ